MEASPFQARRASVDDLPSLQALWQELGMPWEQLGQFISEFQVVTDENEQLAGAIGLLIEGDDALLHSEAIRNDVEADAVRASMWRRMQIVARNQGAKFLWTQEDAPYWRDSGFGPAPAERLQISKASFLDQSADWRMFLLVDPARIQDALQEQFAILEATRLQNTETFERKVKLFRTFAYLLALAVIGGCFALLFVLASNNPDFFRRLLGR